MVTRATARKKGPWFEKLIADYLKSVWSEFIIRKPKEGASDKGDIAHFRVRGKDVVIECKNEVSFQLGTWVKEAQKEANNAGFMAGVVVAKRPKTQKPGEQYVITTLDDFLTILRHAENR